MRHGFLSRKGKAFAPLWIPLTLVAGSAPAHRPPSLPPPAVQAAEPLPGRISVSRLLWPGAFAVASTTSRADPLFEASGRRYVAEARSDGFLIRRGMDTEKAIDVRFVEAEPGIGAELSEQIPGPLTLYKKQAGAGVVRRWNRYSVATFREVYPGIAARYRENGGDLELDFIVAPGANPRRIELRGAKNTRFAVDRGSGDIEVDRGSERFRMHRPRAFQPTTTGLEEVGVRAVAATHSLRFELSAYDSSRPVLIDPLVATWSTFLGTDTDAMYDDSVAVATDSSGNLYVAGLTQLNTQEQPGDSFPTTPQSLNPPDPRSLGDNCAFQCGYVLKLTAAHQIVYGALIYGLTVNALAVDAAGSAYITGSTLDANTFPGTPGVFDNDPSGQVFVSKISADGSAFVYSALFPGDKGNGIAVDTQGNAYVVGQVSVPNLPTTAGSIKPSNPIGATINQDGFLLKINPSGSALVYGTYLGGGGADVANAVQVDAQGEAVVVGQTASNDFVGMPATISGTSDAFLLRVSSDGSQIVAGQTFGGSGDDVASGVAADGGGGWITCGTTTSPDLPISNAAVQAHLLGQRNGWVRRVDAAFNTIYTTYFGGSAIDGCLNVASDAGANAYLVGVTFSADLPVTAGAFQEATSAITHDGFAGLTQFYALSILADRESYFAELSASGALLYGSYLGGYETTPRDFPPLTIGTGVTVGPTGTVSVSGATEAASFPITDGGLRASMGGEGDGFIVSFADSPVSITTPSLLPAAPVQMPYSVALAASGGTPPYTWVKVGFELPDGITLSSAGTLSGSVTNQQTENGGYQFTVKATDAMGQVAYKSFFLNPATPGNLQCSGSTCLSVLGVRVPIAWQIPALARGMAPQTATQTGQLPPGISVSSSGSIAGQATATGNYQFGFIVRDALGASAPLNFDVQVTDLTQPGATLTATPTSVAQGAPFTLAWSSYLTSGCVASDGGANGAKWAGNLPIFGSITQSASAVGTFQYTVSCPSGANTPQVAHASVTVTSPNSGTGGSGSGSSGGSSGRSSGGGGGLGLLELGFLAGLAVVRYRRRCSVRVQLYRSRYCLRCIPTSRDT